MRLLINKKSFFLLIKRQHIEKYRIKYIIEILRAWLSGRAFRCQRKGRRFESARPLHKSNSLTLKNSSNKL